MNKQISQLGIVAIVLLATLIVATTYWQTWANAGLADRQDNEIRLVAQFSIKRGKIYASDGTTLLATNVVRHVSGQTLYFRRYPTGPLFSHVVGYSTETKNQTGLEESYNDFLTASNSNLDTVFHATLDRLKGSTITGNDLILSIRPAAQALALRLLQGKCGAVVALNPTTGAVLTMVSSPSYNPNLIERHFNQIRPLGTCGPLLNRATSGGYVPGSSFKVVTATAALDTGKFTPNSQFYDPGYCVEYGKQVHNAGNPEAPETFGNVTLLQGLQHSINSVFCNVGKTLGAGTILDYMKRYGFYKLPPIDLPDTELLPSGLYTQGGKLFWPKHAEFQVDPGRLAFGQERLKVTPLQMAMVAATVANHGVEMKPYLVQRVVSPAGKTVTTAHPHAIATVVKTQTASELNTMMQAVVTGGTGTAAQIPGIPVAGKTGTAETAAGSNVYTAWFIAFAPADHPKVAVAVVLEHQVGGFGGVVSAPIAKQVMEALLK